MNKLITLCLLLLISTLSAIDYEIQDIGTLQTKSSEAIDINKDGQILGFYNTDGSNEGKHYFLRDADGTLHEIPRKENNDWEINWRYLKNNGKIYGTFDGNSDYSVLYSWDKQNGVTKLGNLPGKEITAINDAGKILIKSIIENNNGIQIIRPVIWHNGSVIKLKGLEGNLGIPSEQSYGLDMNCKGEVVGYSVVDVVYKNEVYKQIHATKWHADGSPEDLHNKILKSQHSYAVSINDKGDILLDLINDFQPIMGLVCFEGNYYLQNCKVKFNTISSLSHLYDDESVIDIKNDELIIHLDNVNNKILHDSKSIWMMCNKIIKVSDNGEIIAEGQTIYNEIHAMVLKPIIKTK